MAQYAYRPPGYSSDSCSCSSSSSSSYSSCSCGKSKRRIDPDLFYAWTKQKMYETTYQAVHNKGSPERKNGIIPGYTGYIPGEKAQAFYAKNNCRIAKEVFNDPNLGQNKFGLSSTGFNLQREALVDPTVVATTHKYGAVTQQKPHPAIDAKGWVTHAQDTFQNPNDLIPPTYRPDFAPEVKHGAVVDLSGYGVNGNTFDGRNELVHVADKVEERLNRRTTEYRVRYNTAKPLHPNPTIFKPRTLEKQRNPLNIN